MRFQVNLSVAAFPWTVRQCLWVDGTGGDGITRRYLVRDPHAPEWPPRYLLETETGLFKTFADLEPTEAGILAFANQYGPLLLGSPFAEPITAESPKVKLGGQELDYLMAPTVRVHGESLDLWRREIEAMRDALAKSVESEEEAFRFPSLQELALRWSEAGNSQAARSGVAQLVQAVNERLSRHVEAALANEERPPALSLKLCPVSLLGALWLQFAQALQGHRRFQACADCGQFFEMSRSPTTGKRRDALYCRAACRVDAHRKRIAKAQAMRLRGVSVARIARDLKTTVKRVEGWTAHSDKKRITPKAKRRGMR